jgi:DnaK suppressor protein
MERWLQMTRKRSTSLKKRLSENRRVLIRKIREIRRDLCNPIGRPVRDSGDRILAYNRRNLLLSQSSRLRANLRLVEFALVRMKEGTYGQCSECGRSIEARRLSAVPWAHLCVKCQEQEEIRGLFAGERASVWLPEKSTLHSWHAQARQGVEDSI